MGIIHNDTSLKICKEVSAKYHIRLIILLKTAFSEHNPAFFCIILSQIHLYFGKNINIYRINNDNFTLIPNKNGQKINKGQYNRYKHEQLKLLPSNRSISSNSSPDSDIRMWITNSSATRLTSQEYTTTAIIYKNKHWASTEQALGID